MYPDGGGLYLQVTGAGAKSWIYRYTLAGRTREMGLGPFHTFDLKTARERAAECRRLRHDGIDPIDGRREQRQADALEAARRVTFKDAAETYIESRSSGWKNAKHAEQWRNTLATYAYPVIVRCRCRRSTPTMCWRCLSRSGRQRPRLRAACETASRRCSIGRQLESTALAQTPRGGAATSPRISQHGPPYAALCTTRPSPMRNCRRSWHRFGGNLALLPRPLPCSS